MEKKGYMTDIILQPEIVSLGRCLLSKGIYKCGIYFTVHIFVSHVTGFSAHFSTQLIDGNIIKAGIFLLLVPLFFLVGAFSVLCFTEVRKKKNQSPVYIHILMLLSVLFY